MSRRRSTPQSVVGFALGQQGKTRADLEPLLGSKSRVSEFISGKRRLSLAQIIAVRKALGIPADLLIETSLELDEPVVPGELTASGGVAVQEPSGVRGAEQHAEPRAGSRAEFDALLAAQRDFLVRLNRMMDEATRSMGRRW